MIPKYGAFESYPAIWTPDEAWVLFGSTWRELNAFEVRFNAALMSKPKFDKTFCRLPPLPTARPAAKPRGWRAVNEECGMGGSG
jgi:hypothetical protein